MLFFGIENRHTRLNRAVSAEKQPLLPLSLPKSHGLYRFPLPCRARALLGPMRTGIKEQKWAAPYLQIQQGIAPCGKEKALRSGAASILSHLQQFLKDSEHDFYIYLWL